VFFSLYDTAVIDRNLYKKKSLPARLLYGVEWLASRLADVPFLDTKAHAEYFADLYHLPRGRIAHVPVGVESENFSRPSQQCALWDGSRPMEVLFYGQFIPLHGLDTLVDAIALWEKSPPFPIQWTIVGRGQESTQIDARIKSLMPSRRLSQIRRIPWIAYDQLFQTITEADLCCGIFGTSEKANRVIPNKVYQILAMSKPLITGDTAAIREIVRPGPAVELVTPGDPVALTEGLEKMGQRMLSRPGDVLEAAACFPIYDRRFVEKDLMDLLMEKH